MPDQNPTIGELYKANTVTDEAINSAVDAILAGRMETAYPIAFQRGAYFRRVVVERPLTPEERERIPERHRPDANQLVTRTEVRALDMPPFVKVAN